MTFRNSLLGLEPEDQYDESYEDWLALTMATAPLPEPEDENEMFYENAF